MQVGSTQPNAVQAEVSMSVNKGAQGTSAAMVNKLMSGAEQGADQARASQGVGTQLNAVA